MISIYKPNSKNTGCACSFSRAADGSIFLNAVQQYSWDDKAKTGSFSENAKDKDKSVSVKLNQWEAGGLIRALNNWEQKDTPLFNAFHSHEDNKTSITLTSWLKKDGVKAYGLSIVRNSADKFRLPIEPSEAQVILNYLTFCLSMNFMENERSKKNTNS